MNQTLNERARSMRIHAGSPKYLWAEAVNAAAYLINMSPLVPLDMMVPAEVCSGMKVDYSFLRVFGCTAYVMTDPDKRDKLDPKSKKCYLVGYGTNAFGYRF